jgi:hypothetical protein
MLNVLDWRLRRIGVSLVLILVGFASSARPQQLNASADRALSQAAEQAVRMAHSGVGDPELTISRRQDLEQLLLTVEGYKPGKTVLFYEIHSPPRTDVDASSIWIVSVIRSEQGVYSLHSFEASGKPLESSQEFNGLISELALSISKDKATSLATLFVKSLAAEPGEIVSDESDLRRVVENYYYALYGDIWRALDAYSRWWQGHQADEQTLAPTVELSHSGNYHVTLNRALMIEGRHPQVQKLDLDISPKGMVNVLASQPLSPRKPEWLFFDTPGMQSPPFE